MAELEQQIAEHNILQREIEAYGQQLRTLVGPVSASLSGLVCQARSAGLQGRDVGGSGSDAGGGITLHPASHWSCFSPWLRQDATNIRNQYRDLLVSWEMD